MSLTFYLFKNSHTPKIAEIKTEKIIKQVNPYLEEAGSMSKSRNKEWWLNSGGRVFIKDGFIKTFEGELPEKDRWRKLYAKNNPEDTDNGYHPQNIFRLINRGQYQNLSQQVYFKIVKDNLSSSVNRDVWSGVFLLNRYLDGNNLYYTGLRADGYAVIKKKTKGIYYTMDYKEIYPGKYDRNNSPNLLPHNQEIGIKSEVVNLDAKRVLIKLFIDKDKSGNWNLVAETIDDGKSFGGEAILSSGYAGLRTDFMDVEFEGYEIEKTIISVSKTRELVRH